MATAYTTPQSGTEYGGSTASPHQAASPLTYGQVKEDAGVNRVQLKRLDFVWQTASKLLAFSVWLQFLPYRAARFVMPDFIDQYINQVEGQIYRLVQPLLNWLTEWNYGLLSWVDARVDSLLVWWAGVLKENDRHHTVAREAYLQLFQDYASNISKTGISGLFGGWAQPVKGSKVY